jgi:tetratricopeptide (TPR) repeat protein
MALQPQAPAPQPDPELQAGLQYLRAGLYDRAEPVFRAALGRYGEKSDILHYLAVALAEAEALWRKAVAKDPNEPMLSYNLGLVARRLGRLDEAAKRFRDTIRRAPAHVEARLALAAIHIDQDRFVAAERELSEVIGGLDRAIDQPGGERVKPLRARGFNMMGHVLYRLGHYSPAIEVLDMALADAGEDAGRRGQIMGDRALALAGLGRHDEAIAEAGRALELAPQNPSLHHVLGFVLYFAGRVSDAIAPIEKALELDPRFTRALRTLALAQTAAGQTDAAIDALHRALRQNPLDRDAILQLSFLHIDRGRFEHEARRALKRASRLATDDPLVLTNLGRVLVDLGRPAEARPLHEHALRGLPGDSRLLSNYGVCLVALGERDKARETLDAALAADPNNAEALAARTGLDS